MSLIDRTEKYFILILVMAFALTMCTSCSSIPALSKGTEIVTACTGASSSEVMRLRNDARCSQVVSSALLSGISQVVELTDQTDSGGT